MAGYHGTVVIGPHRTHYIGPVSRQGSVVTSGNLVRIGFRDGDRAAAGLRGLGEGAEPLAPLLARSADPDQALAGLLSLIDAVDEPTDLVDALVNDEGTSMRLFSVLGMSQALGDHLRRHPEHWRELTDPSVGSVSSRQCSGCRRRWSPSARLMPSTCLLYTSPSPRD